MPFKKLLLHTLIGLSTALTACRAYEPKLESRAPSSEKDPTSGDIVGDKTIACYLSKCFETISMNQINDPKDNYSYPNPNELDDAYMRPYYQAPLNILDLSEISDSTPIAPNFLFKDFMSARKGGYGLYSSHVVTQLQLMRNFIKKPIIINSGYRSPGYNGNVGGAARWSRHTYGDGVDFYVPGKKMNTLTELCEKFGASFTLTYDAHIHCDWRKSPADLAFFNDNKKSHESDSQFTVAEVISSKSEILVRESEGKRVLLVNLAIDEDEMAEGPLTYAWTVTWPDGRSLTAHTAQLELPIRSERIHVQVLVGGSIFKEQTYEW